MSLAIGTMLKNVRKELGLTQQQVCFEMNIEQPTLSNYEMNNRVPQIDFLIKFANRYNISLDYLLGTDTADNLSPSDRALISRFHQASEKDRRIVLTALELDSTNFISP